MTEVGDSAGGTTSRPKAPDSKSEQWCTRRPAKCHPRAGLRRGEGERTLAQAALTIAELGREVHWCDTRMAAE